MRFPTSESNASYYVRNRNTLPRDWMEQQRLSEMTMFAPGWSEAGRENGLPSVPPLPWEPDLTGTTSGTNNSSPGTVSKPFPWLMVLVALYFITKKRGI